MIHADKVKLMDSGTVLFRAASPFFYSVVRAVVEPMSEEGRYAASFQEGNRCRCVLWPFPSRRAWRRMDQIKKNCL